ncbi:MAG TPA: histidine kinase [Pyrinomonadaceae bacterium]|nr:histidine kinase [Pyrinomonadaceae bacterium]
MGDTKQIIRLRWVWVVWALLGLFFACQLYISGSAAGRPVSLPFALLLGQVNAHLYLLASIPVLSLAGRFEPWRGNRPARVMLHASASVAFSAVVLTLQIGFQLWLGHPAGLGDLIRPETVAAFFDKFNGGIYVYWLTVLALYAYAYYVRGGRDTFKASRLKAGQTHVVPSTVRARLRPHLLFNTLNTVATLMHEDVEAAEAMLINTSAFLRGALSETQEVPLRLELDTFQGYLHMDASRFEGDVRVRVDIDPAAEWALVPNTLLLPLAENAIKHGTARSASGSRIEVAARREGDRLSILVSNDCDGETAGEPSPQKGEGLANTRARLQHFYGPAHRFEAGHSPGGGFLVHIEIPFRVRRPAPVRADNAEASVPHDPSLNKSRADSLSYQTATARAETDERRP